jgi:hypothetical protein
MTSTMRLAVVFLGLALWGVAASARAEEPAADQWQFSVAPYLWATSLNGDVTVRGHRATVDASFLDILEDTDSIIGFEGHGEAHKGDWGLYLDGVYTRMGARTNPVEAINIDTTVEMGILEGGVLYRVGNWDLGNTTDAFGGGETRLVLETYAGARYTSLTISNNISVAGLKRDDGGDKAWVDPLVGARATLNLTERLQFILGGDIGGFGAGSEMTWSAIGLIGYSYKLFGLDATTAAGYKALYQDYKDGNGTHDFKWDMTIHGPIIGTIIRF